MKQLPFKIRDEIWRDVSYAVLNRITNNTYNIVHNNCRSIVGFNVNIKLLIFDATWAIVEYTSSSPDITSMISKCMENSD